MPRRISFEGRVQEFPDDATDDEIRSALEGGSPKPSSPSQLPSLSQFAKDSASNFLPSAGRYLQGIAQAVTHPRQTLEGIGAIPVGLYEKLGGPTPEAWGKPGERQAERQLDALGASYKQRYGSIPQAVNTISHDPVGAASDLSAFAGVGAGAARMANLGKTANTLNAVSQAANPLVGMPRLAAKAVPDYMVRRMYQGSLKPPPGSYSASEVSDLVNTGLNEGIPVSPKGLGITRGKIDDINQTVSGKIGEGAAAGKTVDPEKVAGYTERSIRNFTTVDPADKAPIVGVRDRFLNQHSTPMPYTEVAPALESEGYVAIGKGENRAPKAIPVDEAQKLKSNTYREIRDSAYGEQVGAVREAKKDLARGLKEGIYEHYPELRDLGQREKVLIDLENVLERYANRHGNRDMISLGGPAKVLAGATGGPVGGAIGAVAAALEVPAIKSRVAIALRAAQRAKRRTPAEIQQGLNAAAELEPHTQDEQP